MNITMDGCMKNSKQSVKCEADDFTLYKIDPIVIVTNIGVSAKDSPFLYSYIIFVLHRIVRYLLIHRALFEGSDRASFLHWFHQRPFLFLVHKSPFFIVSTRAISVSLVLWRYHLILWVEE